MLVVFEFGGFAGGVADDSNPTFKAKIFII